MKGTYRNKKNKSRKNIKRKTRRYRKNKMGGHLHEDLPHYHLLIRAARGSIHEMSERFERSKLDRNVEAGTIEDLKQFVIDRGLNTDTTGTPQPFTLFWNGKKLEDSNVKLRKIVVEGKKIPLYKPNMEQPIVVLLNKDIGDPVYFEAHDIDWRDPDTPKGP
jgi:hypothetical protein